MTEPLDGNDPSNGWEAVAHALIAERERSRIGVEVVDAWARSLVAGAAVLDVGCGCGIPVSQALMALGMQVFGVDASPTLVAEFRRRFPQTPVTCERLEASRFFERKFDAAVAVGVLFLLSPPVQRQVIRRVGARLEPGGRFLFTAPQQSCRWRDSMTRRESVSLGRSGYEAALAVAGLSLAGEFEDEGQNHYYDAVKPAASLQPHRNAIG